MGLLDKLLGKVQGDVAQTGVAAIRAIDEADAIKGIVNDALDVVQKRAPLLFALLAGGGIRPVFVDGVFRLEEVE